MLVELLSLLAGFSSLSLACLSLCNQSSHSTQSFPECISLHGRSLTSNRRAKCKHVSVKANIYGYTSSLVIVMKGTSAEPTCSIWVSIPFIDSRTRCSCQSSRREEILKYNGHLSRTNSHGSSEQKESGYSFQPTSSSADIIPSKSRNNNHPL